ncbi:hypothetical protein TPY_3213 [Sulfobacillus acidophilus TPY]|uniref:Uncharacterized protein n=1 Tax=Sulfobacillus acidophilus (strain ATCC 700253 / DSM 10332 / NAL) TaxID=679936 RepID=G8TZF6_SULAD|nr:hypothetical protein TPY_3213 [Sulfobacillus acidophilus TPY]AEW05196.1 hypothetical protein Sulac_1700 [Sulfobacillus acidophilus DSM 10332]
MNDELELRLRDIDLSLNAITVRLEEIRDTLGDLGTGQVTYLNQRLIMDTAAVIGDRFETIQMGLPAVFFVPGKDGPKKLKVALQMSESLLGQKLWTYSLQLEDGGTTNVSALERGVARERALMTLFDIIRSAMGIDRGQGKE